MANEPRKMVAIFDWKDLNGKVLKIIVAKSNDKIDGFLTTVTTGYEEETGNYYILNMVHEKTLTMEQLLRGVHQ